MPSGMSAMTCASLGSRRSSECVSLRVTHTEPAPTATALGKLHRRTAQLCGGYWGTEGSPHPAARRTFVSPIGIVATTRLSFGLILVSVPSLELGTQTKPSPTAGVDAPSPTLIVASTRKAGEGKAMPCAPPLEQAAETMTKRIARVAIRIIR